MFCFLNIEKGQRNFSLWTTIPFLSMWSNIDSHGWIYHAAIRLVGCLGWSLLPHVYMSFNIIHLITCWKCGQQYVGETGQLLHRQSQSHLFNITHRRTGLACDRTLMVMDVPKRRWLSWLYNNYMYIAMIHVSAKYEKTSIRTPVTSYPSGINLRPHWVRAHSLWNLLDNH